MMMMLGCRRAEDTASSCGLPSTRFGSKARAARHCSCSYSQDYWASVCVHAQRISSSAGKQQQTQPRVPLAVILPSLPFAPSSSFVAQENH